MDYEQENRKLRACLREIYRTFQYGPGASSSQAPFIMRMIEEALGWEKPLMGGGGGGPTVLGAGGAGSSQTFAIATGSNGRAGNGAMGGGGGGWGELSGVNPSYAIVKRGDGSEYRMSLPSDMPETGIHLDINGKSRTVTKAELQRMIDDGTLKL